MRQLRGRGRRLFHSRKEGEGGGGRGGGHGRAMPAAMLVISSLSLSLLSPSLPPPQLVQRPKVVFSTRCRQERLLKAVGEREGEGDSNEEGSGRAATRQSDPRRSLGRGGDGVCPSGSLDSLPEKAKHSTPYWRNLAVGMKATISMRRPFPGHIHILGLQVGLKTERGTLRA